MVLPAFTTVVGFRFRHLSILTMGFYHTIRVVQKSVVYFVYNRRCKTLFICVQTIQQLHQRMYSLIVSCLVQVKEVFTIYSNTYCEEEENCQFSVVAEQP